MSLSKAPGKWRWELRRGKWWRIHDGLNIHDGPHDLWTVYVVVAIEDEYGYHVYLGTFSSWYKAAREIISRKRRVMDVLYRTRARESYLIRPEPIQ